MPIRCRNYNDDETPVRTFGCPQGDTCTFVHPDNPAWKWAIRRESSSSGRGRGRGRGGGRGSRSESGSRGRSSGSWGGPPPSPVKSADSSWDTSSWGPSTNAWTTKATPRAPKDPRISVSPTQASPTSGTSNDTEKATDGWGSGEGSGWGAASGSGWGTEGGSGWGTEGGSGWGTESGSGWGSWGNAKEAESGSNEGNTTAGKGPAGSAPTDGKTRTMRANNDGIGIVQGTSNHKAPEADAPTTNSTQIMTTAKPPLPTGQKAFSPSSDIVDLPHSTVTSSLKIKTHSIPAVEPVLTSVPDSARPRDLPTTSIQIYTTTIKYLQHAVRLQIDLETAKADVERWKTTQLSASFARATPKTRKELDDQRAKYAQTVSELTKRLDSTIKALSELPDLSVQSHALSSRVDEKELMSYTAQLKDWIKELGLFDRVNPPSPLPERPLDPTEEAWQQIQSAVSELDEITETLIGNTYFRNYTRLLDTIVEPKMASLLEARQVKSNSALADPGEGMLEKANDFGDKLGNVAESAAKLVGNSYRDEQDLTQLAAQLKEQEAAQAQMRESFKQFEEWQKEDAAKIEEITERIRTLHTLVKPVPPPFNLDTLLPELRKLVVDDVQLEISKVIKHLRDACVQNNDLFVKEIYKQLEPALLLTEEICRHAREADGPQNM